MTEAEEDAIVVEVQKLIESFGCRVTGIGPEAVGVMGDARAVGISLTVSFPRDISGPEVMRISNKITNEVRGVTRVLRDIPLS